MLPLEGMKVLDISQIMAGPYCTMVLGDMGADVIKVEVPGRGDHTRSVGAHREGLSTSFLNIN